MKLYYIHLNAEELEERIKPLEDAGYEVGRHSTSHEAAKFEELPDVFILSLDRLASHSRAYADWIWEAKKRQHIPIVFVGGKPDQVEKFKARYPNARFCTQEDLLQEIGGVERIRTAE